MEANDFEGRVPAVGAIPSIQLYSVDDAPPTAPAFDAQIAVVVNHIGNGVESDVRAHPALLEHSGNKPQPQVQRDCGYKPKLAVSAARKLYRVISDIGLLRFSNASSAPASRQ